MAGKSEAVQLDAAREMEEFLVASLLPRDAALDAALAASDAAGLPPINVSRNEGALLHLIVRATGARRVLEIGTLAGYSTIWMARALGVGGKVVTLELSEEHARVARANFENAGVADVIELRVGNALETLPQLRDGGSGPFDLIFIDADKPSNPEYFAWAHRLSRAGSVIIVDNVVRAGDVGDLNSTDPGSTGVRRMFELIAAEPRVRATAVQTIGSKGYDGFAFIYVSEPAP